MSAFSYVCSLPVMWQRWRSAIAENPMLHANFMALCFIEPELLLIEVLHCRNRDFRFFAPVTLTLILTRWPSYTKLRTWPVFYGDIPDVQIWTSYGKADIDRRNKQLDNRHDRNDIPRRYMRVVNDIPTIAYLSLYVLGWLHENNKTVF